MSQINLVSPELKLTKQIPSQAKQNIKQDVSTGCVLNQTLTFLFHFGQTFPVELSVFLREHHNGMYRTDVYFLSKTFAEVSTWCNLPHNFQEKQLIAETLKGQDCLKISQLSKECDLVAQ